jgi:cytochrome c biogenesis protein CcdA
VDYIGLLRQSHVLLYGVTIVFLLGTVVLLTIRNFIITDEVKSIVTKAYWWFLGILLAVVVFNGFSLMSSNRTPRSIEDKSDVYRQAISNTTNGKEIK